MGSRFRLMQCIPIWTSVSPPSPVQPLSLLPAHHLTNQMPTSFDQSPKTEVTRCRPVRLSFTVDITRRPIDGFLCLGSLPVLQLPPTVQKHERLDSLVVLSRCTCECVLFVSVCQVYDEPYTLSRASPHLSTSIKDPHHSPQPRAVFDNGCFQSREIATNLPEMLQFQS